MFIRSLQASSAGTSRSTQKSGAGFTLIEILVTLAVIAVLVTIVIASVSKARNSARDGVRKTEISSFGRFLALGCFVPASGAGDYDLAQIVAELLVQFPQYAQQLSNVPKDPQSGTDTQTNYRYVVNSSGKCALYANYEKDAPATLFGISAATPGGGTGTFTAPAAGVNGSNTYFQYSN